MVLDSTLPNTCRKMASHRGNTLNCTKKDLHEIYSLNIDNFLHEWGVDKTNSVKGGVDGMPTNIPKSRKNIYMLQRKSTKMGKNLGKTTGWIHRLTLQHKKVNMIRGIKSYDSIDDEGLHYSDKDGKKVSLNVDTIVVCAGQESVLELSAPLKSHGVVPYLIGGADVAAELDAKRAIDQGSRLASCIEDANPGDDFLTPESLTAKLTQYMIKKTMG